jgi:MFS family permease
MMDIRVFKNRVYDAAIYAVFATMFCVYGALFIITQYFQNVRSYSPEQTGLLLLAMTIPTIILSPLTGRVVAARGARTPTLIGLGCLVIGTGIFAVSNAQLLWVTLAALAFLGAAGGTSVAAATSVAMGSLPPERSGMASGILSSQRAIGSTAGFAIMGSVLAATISVVLPGNLESRMPDPAQRDQVVAALIGPGKPLPQNIAEDDAVLKAADDAFITGIRVAMLLGFLVSLSSLAVGWWLFPRRAAPTVEEVALEPG